MVPKKPSYPLSVNLMLTNEELEAIREREAKATRGPWFCEIPRIVGYPKILSRGESVEEVAFAVRQHPTQNDVADADFIAAARQDIPALLSHISELEKAKQCEKCGTDKICVSFQCCPHPIDWYDKRGLFSVTCRMCGGTVLNPDYEKGQKTWTERVLELEAELQSQKDNSYPCTCRMDGMTGEPYGDCLRHQ